MNDRMQSAMKTMPNRKLFFAVAAVLLVAAAAILWMFARAEPSGTHAAGAASADSARNASASGLAAADLNGDGIVYQSGMHPWIVEDAPGVCPICGMDLVPVRVDGSEEGTVRIDPVTMQNIGVRTAPVVTEPLQRTVRTTGRFAVNEQRSTVVAPKIGGWIEKLHVNFEGARVAKGSPLLEIYSPELVSTQEEYLLALRNAERLGGGDDAARLVDAARRRLSYWDVTEEQIRRLEATGRPQKTLTLHAPASGTVVETNVVEGQQIAPGQMLMRLSDLSSLWLMVDVYEQDLAWVNVGTTATIELPYDPGRTLNGRIGYIYDELDAATRTVKARVQIANPGLKLKPQMYATVHLFGDRTEALPLVPSESVIRAGDREVVIVALGDGRFRPVEVQTGIESDGRVQVLDGLHGDEIVVTSAQFLIDSEARLASAVSAMVAGQVGSNPETADEARAKESVRQHDGSPRDGSPAGRDAPPQSKAMPAARPMPAAPNDVQIVEIDIDADGDDLGTIHLKKGVPIRLILTRRTDKTCATDIVIPDFDVAATPLPLNQPVAIEMLPKEDGTFTFACEMDMVRGLLVVSS